MTRVMQYIRAVMGLVRGGFVFGIGIGIGVGIAVLGAAPAANAESTISCPAGTYDMLDWMTMDSDLRSTNHMEGTSNPLYTVMEAGKFYWVKGPQG